MRTHMRTNRRAPSHTQGRFTDRPLCVCYILVSAYDKRAKAGPVRFVAVCGRGQVSMCTRSLGTGPTRAGPACRSSRLAFLSGICLTLLASALPRRPIRDDFVSRYARHLISRACLPPLSLAPRRFELWNKGLRHAAAGGNTTAAPAGNGTGDNSTSDGGADAAAGSGCSSCGGHFSTEEERAAAAAAAAKRAAPIQLASAATRLAPADAETRRPARLSLSPRVGARQRSH